MRKQLILWGILLMMLSLCFESTAFAEEVPEGITKRYRTMKKMNIMSEEITDFSAEVKRGEFVRALVKLGGYDAKSIAGKSAYIPYEDVSDGSEYRLDVNAAYSLGYLSAEKKTFRPDDIITAEEAAEMLNVLLGYNVLIRNGRMNDISMAYETGLFDGVDKNIKDGLTYRNMVSMFYNALFTEVVDISGGNSNSISYEEKDILLTRAFDIIRGKGVVEANPVTSIYAKNGCSWGCIRIDNISYYADPEYYNCIGMNTEYFYREEEGVRRLVYLQLHKEESVMTIDAESIEELSETRLTYYNEKGKTAKQGIEPAAAFIYNGKLKKFAEIDTAAINCGKITLIDSNADDRYDVVSIEDYVHITVQGTDKTNQLVYGRDNGQVYCFEHKENQRIAEIYEDNKKISVEDLREGDVLSVAESENIGVSRIYASVCRKTITGSVTYADNTEVVIEGESYKYDADRLALRANDYGTFYLAEGNRIVTADLEDYVVYGYLYKIAEDELDEISAKIYTDKGRWVIVKLAPYVTYNRTRIKKNEILNAAEFYGDGKFKPQLVAYRVNNDNQVIKLDTAKSIARWSEEESRAIENAEFRLSLIKGSGYFRKTLSSFDMEVTLKSNCYVFVIPGSFGDEKIDEDKISLKTRNCFIADVQYNNLYFYDVSQMGEAPVIAVYGDVLRMVSTDMIYPVSYVGYALDRDGNQRKMIAVIHDGYEIRFTIGDDAENVGTTVQKGDVIRFIMDDKGNIGRITLVNRPTDSAYENKITNSAYHTWTLISGTLEYIDHAQQKAVIRYGESRVVYDISSVGNVYRHDLGREIIQKTDKSELVQGQRIFIQARYGKIQEAIFYEE